MKEQTIFNTVVRHLAKQGKRAVTVQGGWLRVEVRSKYRGPNGTKCPVGYLLKDSEYDPGMEGKPVGLIKLPKRLQPHEELLIELQRAHDTLQSAHDLRQEGSNCAPIRDRLERIAHRWNLDSRILGTLTFPEVWK